MAVHLHLLWLFLSGIYSVIAGEKPHIIFIVADDMGWNDIGWNNPNIKTPRMDTLANDGIILNKSYTTIMCTPSRASFMTGYYPFKLGLQHGVIFGCAGSGLPTGFQLLPKKLNELGYATHLVGKWHLGNCHESYLPQNRGFDTAFAIYPGLLDYYTYSIPGVPNSICLFNGTHPVRPEEHKSLHLSDLFGQQVKNVIESNSKKNKPLFLYYALNLPHSPLEPTEQYLRLYKDMTNEARKGYSGLVSMVDDEVGKLVDLLKQNGLYDNSVVVFTSDNGAQVHAGGSNYPLRGSKPTYYEGGVRVPAFIHSPLLKKRGFVYDGFVNGVDWFPTLVTLAGGTPDPSLDGINIWNEVTNNLPSPRKEFIYGIDNFYYQVRGAIRVEDMKLIVSKAGLPNTQVRDEDVDGGFGNGIGEGVDVLDEPQAPQHRLFNISNDPYEEHDLAQSMPEVVDELRQHFDVYFKMAVKPVDIYNVPECDFDKFGGICGTHYCEPIEQPEANIPYIWMK